MAPANSRGLYKAGTGFVVHAGGLSVDRRHYTPVNRPVSCFGMLSPEEQVETVRRLVDSGLPDHTIAACTGLAVEQVRRVIGARGPETP